MARTPQVGVKIIGCLIFGLLDRAAFDLKPFAHDALVCKRHLCLGSARAANFGVCQVAFGRLHAKLLLPLPAETPLGRHRATNGTVASLLFFWQRSPEHRSVTPGPYYSQVDNITKKVWAGGLDQMRARSFWLNMCCNGRCNRALDGKFAHDSTISMCMV